MEFSFLYQTRTILRPVRLTARRGLSNSLRACTTGPSLHSKLAPSKPSRQDVEPKDLYFKQVDERRRRAAAGEPQDEVSTDIPVMPTSTITATEQRKFAELEQRALQQQYVSQSSSEIDQVGTDVDKILALFPGPSQRRNERLSDEIDESYPELAEYEATRPSLDPAKQIQQHDSTSQDNLVAQICRHQLQNYYHSFNDALKSKSGSRDLAIFTILKTRVFPLVDLITPSSSKSPAPPSPSSSGLNKFPRKATKNTPTSDKSSKHASTPSHTSSSLILPINDIIKVVSPATQLPPAKTKPLLLPIISRLYPAATLLALRLLVKNCPSSQLTSSLLPIIRNLGPTSYILAANTHFYNTFLLLRWNLYSSLSEICSLLSEMERGAVEFDAGTARFLADVAEERARDLYMGIQPGPDREKSGGADDTEVFRGAAWWQKREQVEWWYRVEEWRGVIGKRLDEKGVEIVGREGPYGSLIMDKVSAGELWAGSEGEIERGRDVWL